MNKCPDPPWMGLSEEDYENKCRLCIEEDDSYEEYLADKISEKREQMRNELRDFED